MGIGAVFLGTGFRKDEILSGYTQIEELIFFGFVVIGFLTGALLLAGISRQLWKVLEIGLPKFRIPVARMVAGVATGFWLWELSLFWNVPATLPKLPLLLFTLSLVLLLWQRLATRPFQLQILIACFVLGYFPGMLGYSWPHYWIILLGIQGLVLPFIIYKKPMGRIPDILLMCLAGFSAGGYLQNFAFENLSYPQARSVFYLLLLVGFAMVVKLLLETFIKPERSASLNKYGGLALLALCLFAGFVLLSQTYNHSISSLISSGFLPIPLVSIVFLFLAFFLWPRKRKIHKHLEVKHEPPVVSLGLLLLAVFLLPVHLKTKNPWYSLDAMDPEGIHTVVESKLLNTYTAFNITDEEILFERLNENLEEDLLDHIYLDSRRRLTMGLREGSTVTVREVDLTQLGEPLPDVSPEVGTQYPATWTVTAQVKHLKHIHYRKNKYTGTIALKSIDDVWKISEIILTSEDREVIASGNL